MKEEKAKDILKALEGVKKAEWNTIRHLVDRQFSIKECNLVINNLDTESLKEKLNEHHIIE